MFLRPKAKLREQSRYGINKHERIPDIPNTYAMLLRPKATLREQSRYAIAYVRVIKQMRSHTSV
ncbi:MAG: hypothetical protein F6J90_38250 [Moorea sp. SIOASIH]|uniref:hypothetical protein n=1 Tax=Moorena sp. SIOASIH TaxID=2607817 RepID=UPI0013BAB9CD|nr:hypothetical protein [Moorena sp. SIOASIH]NEO41854.1 hypothetical protein [Moorena sp. SIOASIH]